MPHFYNIRKRTRRTHHVDARHQKLTCTRHARDLNDVQKLMCMVHHVLFSCNYYEVTFDLRTVQKAKPAGSVCNRLPNEHGEHGAECWLRLHISYVFQIFGYSYS